MQRYTLGDFGWKGMNKYLQPERIPPGYAAEIQNMDITKNGYLTTRSGFVGLLSAKQTGGGIYGLSFHRTNTGDNTMVWSQDNKLWKYAGSNTATDITGTVTVSSAGVGNSRWARWGSYTYGCDGTNAMFRWNGTGNFEAVSGLNTPATAPTISLGAASTLVSTIGTLSNYSQPYAMDSGNFSPADLIYERNFENSSGTTITSQWNADAGQPTIKTATSLSGNVQFVELDYNGGTTAKEYVITDPIVVPDDGTSSNTGSRLYVMECYAWSKNNAEAAQVLDAQVRLYTDTGGTTIISGTSNSQYSTPLNPTTPTKVRLLFDYRDISSDPASCKLRLGAPNATTGSGGAGVNVNRVSLVAPKQEFQLVSSNGALLVNQGSVQVWDGSLLTAGLRIYSTAISNQNWAGKTQAWFDLNVDVDVSGLSMRLLLKSGTTWYTGGTLFKDPSGGYIADLTQFTSTVLGDVDGFGFEVVDDIVVTGITAGGNKTLFTLVAIKEGGNLSNGMTYTYRFSEWDGTSVTVTSYEAADGKESSGSPISADVTTTAGARTATVTIPARTNAASDQYLIWREGGVYDDGRYRLVGVATASASAITFTDTVSDADLYDRPIYQIGRDQFPSGVNALAVHHGRLWAAKGNTVYVSWVLNEGQETGLYTTNVPDPDDPYIGIKGASFTLDTTGNKSIIKALIPYGTTMLAIRDDSVVVISGYDATNFAAQPYLQGMNLGMVNAVGADVVGGKVWFQSRDSVLEFNGDAVTRVALEAGEPKGNHGILANNEMVYVYSNTKYASSPDLSYIYVYNTNYQGWVQYSVGFEPVSGCTFYASGSGAPQAYFGASDGQIYYLSGDKDKGTSGATGSFFTSYVTTRKYGQYEDYSPARMAQGMITQIDMDYQALSPITVSEYYESPYNGMILDFESTLPAVVGDRLTKTLRGKPSYGRGVLSYVTVGSDSSAAFSIYGLTLYYSETKVPRL